MYPPTNDLRRPAAFLDRDGTLVVERNFLGDPDAVEILPGVPDAIRTLNRWGFWVVGVSNQSGVARNYFGISEVEAVNQRIIDMLAASGARLDRIYYCPHFPGGPHLQDENPCTCRKPAPGMIERALAEFPIDLSQSFVVGDQAADIGLALAVGIPGVLVLTGFGQWQSEHPLPHQTPDFVAENLMAAVQWFGRRTGRPVLDDPDRT